MKPTSIRLTKAEATICGKHIPGDALARHCPLDNGCLFDPNNAPAPGPLSELPIELQHQVLLSLDVKSLLSFRQVNKHAMNVVDDLTEWKKVIAQRPWLAS
jgi:hypothetical protein